ncbi:MAG: RNA polymerase sigma factor [Proteobacteria bacterium]|nr:RNA polymerase sigma factor [Pseudomonadota bacterium]
MLRPSTIAPDAASAAMDRYADGDDAAFEIVYDQLSPVLYGVLRRRLTDTSVAEDLVQETFIRMHRARGQFRRGASASTWAIAIALRLWMDHLRCSGRRRLLREELEPVLEVQELADTLMELKQSSAALDGILADLPRAQRLAFEFVKLDGLSLAQTAEVMGTTVPSVKALTHRAYAAIRVALRGRAGRD